MIPIIGLGDVIWTQSLRRIHWMRHWLSFRSKGKYKVSEIAKKMGGGGHPFAAAALVEGEFSDVKSNVLSMLSTYINKHNEDNIS